MRTTANEALLSYLVPSRVRREVLCALLLDEREWHPREMSRVLGLTNSAVAVELYNLRMYGIALGRRVGNQSRYRANTEHPIYAELRGLLVKTSGVADRLRIALAGMEHANRLRSVYIFGSFADGSQNERSDVDVMVIGEVPWDEVIEALEPVEQELRRQINSTVYWPSQYEEELSKGDGFVKRVSEGPKIMLMGSADESR